MGFERLVSVVQGQRSNYDTDIFTPIFQKVQELSGVRPYQGKFGADDEDGIDTAYRVVADHIRTLAFALSDGGVPSNIGRGYVLRRILRRGSRYARKKLGVPIGSFFSSLLPVVVEQMVILIYFRSDHLLTILLKGDVFPELTKNVGGIREILDEEEESFSRTLDRGERLFDQYATKARQQGATELSGKDVWRLYDTYGFPVDLTRLMAEELALGVNEEEFEQAQLLSKEASKASSKKGVSDVIKLDVHGLAALEKDDVPKTNDFAKFRESQDVTLHCTPTECVVELGNVTAQVKAIYHDRSFVESTSAIPDDTIFGILLDRTCFYAEAGGQEYDTGNIVIDGAADFQVTNVQVYNGYVLHTGHLKYGQLDVGNEVLACYDEVCDILFSV
jgi:alanyl-tRNA synthetase